MVLLYRYIYNTKQNIFYIKNGLVPVDIGTGNKGHAFLKYIKDDKYDEIFKKWCELKIK